MSPENLKVLAKIILAVETGGQVYGKARYNDFTPPYKNSKKEHTITLGAGGFYGHQARKLVQMIYDKDPKAFEKLDTANIKGMLSKDWEAIKWNPNEKQKQALIAIIDSPIGHECQDELMAERCKTLVEACAKKYPKADEKAQMMYAEIAHLGGAAAAKRIFDRCNGNYSLDNIMTALVADQKDKSSNNQVGDKIYWSRHLKCRQFIDEHYINENEDNDKEDNMTEEQAIQKVLSIAEAEVGYQEKRSPSQLNDKTANAGSGNYTKYNDEMHKIQPSNMDFGAAWCDCFVDWCFYKAFGKELAKKVLCGNFDDYTPNSANLYKKAGRWSNTPKRGYQIFFRNSERICHTGLVYKATKAKVYTIEGNSSNAVRKKSYDIADSSIAGYGMPLYSVVVKEESVKPVVPDKSEEQKFKTGVAGFQEWLNTNYANMCKHYVGGLLEVDGVYGQKTRKVAVTIWKYMMNKYYGARLTLGNFNFFEGCKLIAEKLDNTELKKHPTLTVLLQGLLAKEGLYKNDIDGDFGERTEDALVAYKVRKQLGNSPYITAMVWYKLFN